MWAVVCDELEKEYVRTHFKVSAEKICDLLIEDMLAKNELSIEAQLIFVREVKTPQEHGT